MSKKVVIFDIDMPYKILTKAKAKELRELTFKKERDRQNLFLVEGEKSITDIIGYFPVRHIICGEEWLVKHPELEQRYRKEILKSDRRGLEIISSLKSVPEVIGVFEKPVVTDTVEKLSKGKLYLLLDEIQDPGNLGTIVRTCDWFGIYDIFVSQNTTDVYGPKVVQSTMGSLSRIRVHYVDLLQLIKNNKGIPLIGAVLDGLPLKECKIDNGGMLLMGNEGRGISKALAEEITVPVTIPPVNPINHPDSLNVAVSTAIILSHLVR